MTPRGPRKLLECALERTPGAGMSYRTVTRNLGSTLRPLSPTFRKRIREQYDGPNTLNDDARAALAQCVFDVENELEHRTSTHPQVAIMRAVRNTLLDDIGTGESAATAPMGNEARERKHNSIHKAVVKTIRSRRKASV